MFEWMRKLWHPKYGKCGGASRDCSPSKPIDKLDELFAEHDSNLYLSDQLDNDEERKKARHEADQILAKGLRSDLGELSWKGKIYREMAKIVFRVKK